jgi:hypothetical protein
MQYNSRDLIWDNAAARTDIKWGKPRQRLVTVAGFPWTGTSSTTPAIYKQYRRWLCVKQIPISMLTLGHASKHQNIQYCRPERMTCHQEITSITFPVLSYSSTISWISPVTFTKLLPTCKLLLKSFSTHYLGARGGVVVKALRYKPAGRGFDSRLCHWNFSVT